MKRRKEKNIQVFNEDVKRKKSYVYTDSKIYSAYTANLKISAEIVRMVKTAVGRGKITILDVGSGDGTYTFELMEKIKPKKIIGFDIAKEGVDIANKKIRKKDRNKIKFLNSSIYEADKVIKQKFDVVVVRGVLHHLYNPKRAIKAVSNLSDKIIIVEPNGYNPILKVIEKVSPYHRRHEEKSYWPPTLNKWFEKNGFKVQKQEFFGIVPFFFPESLAKMIKKVESFLEKIPYLSRVYCGINLIVYEKQT